jgi:hypothetical protein
MWTVNSFNADTSPTLGDWPVEVEELVSGVVVDTKEEALIYWDLWVNRINPAKRRVVLAHKGVTIQEITLL